MTRSAVTCHSSACGVDAFWRQDASLVRMGMGVEGREGVRPGGKLGWRRGWRMTGSAVKCPLGTNGVDVIVGRGFSFREGRGFGGREGGGLDGNGGWRKCWRVTGSASTRWTLGGRAGGCNRGGSLRDGEWVNDFVWPEDGGLFRVCGTPRLECSVLLYTGGPRLVSAWPRLDPSVWKGVARRLGTVTHWFQAVLKLAQIGPELFPTCFQLVPRHAGVRAKVRVTGGVCRLVKLTRHSLACCHTSPGSPGTLLHVVRFPHPRRHSFACC